MKPALCLAGALLLSCFGLSVPAFATEYPLPADNTHLISENILTTVVPDDKRPLESIAAPYKIGMLGYAYAGSQPRRRSLAAKSRDPIKGAVADAVAGRHRVRASS